MVNDENSLQRTTSHHVTDCDERFRQCILANMRGAGEPIFENDFPPGTDMVGDRERAAGNRVRIIHSARYDGELMDFSVAGKLLSCELTVNLSFLVFCHTYRMCLVRHWRLTARCYLIWILFPLMGC